MAIWWRDYACHQNPAAAEWRPGPMTAGGNDMPSGTNVHVLRFEFAEDVTADILRVLARRSSLQPGAKHLAKQPCRSSGKSRASCVLDAQTPGGGSHHEI